MQQDMESSCRRCGQRLSPGEGVAGYCRRCARELVEGIRKVMPAEAKPMPRPSSRPMVTGTVKHRGMLYTTSERCPVCGGSFAAIRVAMSRLRAEAREPDFYVRYEPLDPNLYHVWVCPHCGYAAPQGAFAPLYPDEKEKLAQVTLESRQQAAGSGGEAKPPEDPGEITREEAIAAYRRALELAPHRRQMHGIAAGLYLRLAWIYRRAGEEENEREMQARALEEYLAAYQGEDGLPGNMNEYAVAYLIGVLCLKTNRLHEAARYLGQVVHARTGTGADPAVRKMAQDQWYELQRVWKAASN